MFNNTRKTIVFRVDGGSKRVSDGPIKRGMGHISRCLAIANELKKENNLNIFFITQTKTEGLKRIQDANYKVKKIPSNLKTKYEQNFVIDFLKKLSPDALIVDMLNTDTSFMSRIKEMGVFLVSIDDLGPGKKYSDLLVYNLIKQAKCKPEQKCYSGPSYIPINKFFSNLKNKKIKKNCKSILVSFGSSDPGGFTIKTVRALEEMPENYDVTILVGPSFSKNYELKKILKKGKKRYKLKYNVNSKEFAKLIQKSDITITSGGLSVYEIAAIGTPGIVLCQNEHENSNIFNKYGTAIKLGLGESLSTDNIRLAIKNLANNKKMRHDRSKRGRKLIDGKGAERIANMVLNELSNQ
jgi:UDP-2,4-diacetamido-2,4,6-trideoxy-beta-L-altropyranose hydrolase